MDMKYTFILTYKNVDKNIDLGLIHSSFIKKGMDVITLSGNLQAGFLSLDISIYDDEFPSCITKPLELASIILNPEATLVRADPDILDRKEICIRTGLDVSNLQRYVKKNWFPRPLINGKCYRLDEVVEALQTNTKVQIEDAQCLIDSSKIARFLNSYIEITKINFLSDHQNEILHYF